MSQEYAFGVVGLRKMGGNLARQALQKGMTVVGATKGEPDQGLLDQGLEYVKDYKGFVEKLPAPRIIFLYVPAGSLIDTLADQLASTLQ